MSNLAYMEKMENVVGFEESTREEEEEVGYDEM
jgi:hypothetical protein